MPTPSDQQPGILAAILGALAGGGIFGAIINWWVGVINRRTALEIKQADKPGAFTDDLQAELTSIRQHNLAQVVELKELNQECKQLRKDFNIATIETVKRERKISHLENELEKLQNMVVMLKDEKARTKQQYDERIVELQNEAVDREAAYKAELAERDATIIVLRQEIADFKKIGVMEPPVPKRQTGGTS